MIQLRRIRYFTPRGSAPRTAESAFDPPIEFESHKDLFKNLEAAIAQIPEGERWNVYYTLGHSEGGKTRKWLWQDVIPFDIDDIVNEDGTFDEDAYVEAVFAGIKVDQDKCVIVASGNGLQVIVQLPQKIESKEFFQKQRRAYENVCKDISTELASRNLRGKVDPSSFAANRIFRLPNTENRKPDRPIRQARLLALHKGQATTLGRLQPVQFPICPIPGDAPKERSRKTSDDISEKQLSYFEIDTPAVEGGCAFLSWAKASPADVSEPAWYALLSIVGRLEDGRKLAHAYSRGHPSYDERGTERKLDQALAQSGPRNCDTINGVWGKCKSCPNFRKVTNPILLKGEDFVSTARSGFYAVSKTGTLIPQFEDLRRHFKKEHPYRVHEKSGVVYVWDGKRYNTWSRTQLRGFADRMFNPIPSENHVLEFGSTVNRSNLISEEWFRTSTIGLINFNNGVLDLGTMELQPHSPDRGFLYVLPYDYDAAAECPRFDQFMGDITCKDDQLVAMLLEFAGYAIIDRDYWLQKALVLIGAGSNGKSTYLKILEEVAGNENVAFLSFHELKSETWRSGLEGKLLNLSDELPTTHIKDTELLKKLFGGTMTTRKLYHDGGAMENNTKFIFSGNEMPASDDLSEGFFRRLAFVPFDAKFSLGPVNAEAKKVDLSLLYAMKAERPGIFNCILGHYRRLKERGYLAEAKRSAAHHQQYRQDADFVGTWIAENLNWTAASTSAKFVQTKDIFAKYVGDAKSAEEKPMTNNKFIGAMRRILPEFKDRYQRERVAGKRVHVLKGIELLEDSPKEQF